MSMDLAKLERRLTRDLESDEDGRRARLRELIETFCKSEASRLTGRTVRDEAQILQLIRIYARTQLLAKLAGGEWRFTKKELLDFAQPIDDHGDAKKPDTINIFAGLPVSHQKMLIEAISKGEK